MSRISVTQILGDIRAGQASLTDLLPLVYEDLHRQAKSARRGQRAGHTLHTTALVHGVAERLLENGKTDWQDRAHFFAVAARAMRQLLTDHARRQLTAKRGGDWERVSLTESIETQSSKETDLASLHEALSNLTSMDERMARVVECRFFGGMSFREIAHVLSVSISTVESDWRTARAWLSRELRGEATT